MAKTYLGWLLSFIREKRGANACCQPATIAILFVHFAHNAWMPFSTNMIMTTLARMLTRRKSLFLLLLILLMLRPEAITATAPSSTISDGGGDEPPPAPSELTSSAAFLPRRRELQQQQTCILRKCNVNSRKCQRRCNSLTHRNKRIQARKRQNCNANCKLGRFHCIDQCAMNSSEERFCRYKCVRKKRPCLNRCDNSGGFTYQRNQCKIRCHQRWNGQIYQTCLPACDVAASDLPLEPATFPPLVMIGDGLRGLDLCQGDCDSDDDCLGSLLCFQRCDSTPVPGK